MIDREVIADAMRRLNEAENLRPETTIEATSDRLDELFAADVHGWTNGVFVPNREAERANERGIFTLLEDYHRDLELMIIEAPYASIGWTIRGTSDGREVVMPGGSHFEFGDDGLIRRYWLYCDASKLRRRPTNPSSSGEH